MDFTLVLRIVPAVLLAAMGTIALAAAYKEVRGTTLLVPWITAAVAVAVWGTVALLEPLPTRIPPDLFSHLWYLASVVALWPPVSVLGARRPIDRAWPVFVLLPLAAVLAVPSLSTLWSRGPDTPLQVETPMLIGFLLVLVMGSGNYLGTRYTLAALLYAAAVVLIVLPSTALGGQNPGISKNPWVLRAMGTVCLAAGLLSARLSARKSHADAPEYDRLWLRFRDAYGIVWAKRVLERVNWSAREESWPAELTFTGLAWRKPDVTDAERRQTIERLTQTFRWLLRRFVGEEWPEGGGRKTEGGRRKH